MNHPTRSFETLQELLAKFRYKEGWEFKASESWEFARSIYGITVRVAFLAPDAYDPKTVRTQVFRTIVEWPYVLEEVSEERWLIWLLGVVIYIEGHEAAEFFTVDGQRPFDPHAQPLAETYGRIPAWPSMP